jgi:hypothetical protein
VDVPRQLHHHLVDAEVPDRLAEVHLLVLQLDAGLRLELLRDVAGGHGAEQLALLADAHLDGDGATLHLREQVNARLIVKPLLAARLLLGAGLGDSDVVVGGGGGQPARQQVVTGEAVGDVLDLADAGGAFDLLHEHDFHATLLRQGSGQALTG